MAFPLSSQLAWGRINRTANTTPARKTNVAARMRRRTPQEAALAAVAARRILQVRPGIHDHGALEGEHAALLGDAGADGGGAAHGGVLLLDEPLGQAHVGGVVVGGVAVDDVLGVLLGVVDFLAAAQVAELAAEGGGVRRRRRPGGRSSRPAPAGA